MKRLLCSIAVAGAIVSKIVTIAKRSVVRSRFHKCGRAVVFDPNDEFSYSKISLGSDIYIGSGACFSTITSIEIGDHTMFGPNVTIRGGNHNTALLGIPMSQIRGKREFDDKPVVIECDVWVGCNVVILKGVTVGRGAVIGAGSIVTKDVPPYSVVVGNPAKVIKYRGTIEEIENHEQVLFEESERLNLRELALR